MDGVEIIQWRSCEKKAAVYGLNLDVSPGAIAVRCKDKVLVTLNTVAEISAFLAGYGYNHAPAEVRIYAQVPKGYYAVKSRDTTGRSIAELCSAEDGTLCAFRSKKKGDIACTYTGRPLCVPASREDGLDVVFKRCRGKQRLA